MRTSTFRCPHATQTDYSSRNSSKCCACASAPELTLPLRLQEGRDVEICNSFELDYKIVNGKVQVDMDYLEIKQEQCE